ncbi:hypothetical protein [Streptomyces niger]|uniref:hypothetical protein n=1 Tax=Streptomyces niger TaxID=66373 RepID=UPI0018FE4292|nr:hypothetical protein [Streptomyces niger]
MRIMYAHRFAQLYPQDVAGRVWLDAFHRDWDDPEHIRQALIDAKMSDEWAHAGVAERTVLAELAAELQAGPNIARAGARCLRLPPLQCADRIGSSPDQNARRCGGRWPDAGVPLARIDAPLAQPAEFAAAVTDIDAHCSAGPTNSPNIAAGSPN